MISGCLWRGRGEGGGREGEGLFCSFRFLGEVRERGDCEGGREQVLSSSS